STAGVAVGIAAFAAFLLRTPAKLVAVDVRRGRWLDRSRLALRIAIVEAAVLAVAVAVAIASAGWSWLIPVLMAGPLVAVELSFEIRSRGRRLVPELCGAVGMAAVAASVVLAGNQPARLAVGLWLVLAARALGAIPFVRVQIFRLLRRQGRPVWHSDVAQAVAVAVATVAVIVDRKLLLGLAGVVVLAAAQSVWVRQAPIPAKRLGMRQLACGLALVALTAAGCAVVNQSVNEVVNKSVNEVVL
ncbi:MAG: YwiC-like family protein, partial [Actinomycetota bacterium]